MIIWITLIVLSIIFLVLLILGFIYDSDGIGILGFVGLLVVVIFGWLIFGSVYDTEEYVFYHEPNSPEIRYFQYGSYLYFYVKINEETHKEIEFNRIEDVKLFETNNWVLQVDVSYNMYGEIDETDFKLISCEHLEENVQQIPEN